MFIMPDIPFAVLVLLVLGYIIYRIVRKIKGIVSEIRYELDDSPETMRRKAHAKEIMEVDELERAGYLSYEEANKESDIINKKYFP